MLRDDNYQDRSVDKTPSYDLTISHLKSHPIGDMYLQGLL